MTDAVTTTRSLRRWIATALFTCGFVMTGELLFTIEWSFPYCNDSQDGPLSAIFGAPIPYERWSGVSSLEYDFVPHFYFFNIAVMAGMMLPIVHVVAAAAARRSPRATNRALAGCGLLLCLAVGGVKSSAVAYGLWRPVLSIARPPYDSWDVLRPVGLVMGRHYRCSPSAFWFEPEWRSP